VERRIPGDHIALTAISISCGISLQKGSVMGKTIKILLQALASTVLLLATALPAQAATTVERDFPFSTVISGCGDEVYVEGTLVVILTEQPLDDGGYLLTYHFQPQGVSGTSASGVMYRATGLTRETFVLAPSGVQTFTFINRFHIVGTAGSPTYTVSETTHLTISQTGEIIAEISDFRETCT
jgi:hypothetical protein